MSTETAPVGMGAFLPCPHCRSWTFWAPEGVQGVHRLDRFDCEGCGARLIVMDVTAEGTVTTMNVGGLLPLEARRRLGDALGHFVLREAGFRGEELERRLRIWKRLGRWRFSHPLGRGIRWLLELPLLAWLNRPPLNLEAKLYARLGGDPDG